MVRYYCSGFASDNAFGYGIGDMLKKELKDTKNIVYIPATYDTISESKERYVPMMREDFEKVNITFEEEYIIESSMDKEYASNLIKNASMIMLMGGNPYDQKRICIELDIIDALKKYDGVMMGYSAGAMFMSKYIIITPCSEEYPEFHIEEGLDLDGISIYPHNNTSSLEYPKILISGDEEYKRDDLIEVAKTYGDYYLLQDNENGLSTDVSIIKSVDGNLSFYYENEGKIWLATKEGVRIKES